MQARTVELQPREGASARPGARRATNGAAAAETWRLEGTAGVPTAVVDSEIDSLRRQFPGLDWGMLGQLGAGLEADMHAVAARAREPAEAATSGVAVQRGETVGRSAGDGVAVPERERERAKQLAALERRGLS